MYNPAFLSITLAGLHLSHRWSSALTKSLQMSRPQDRFARTFMLAGCSRVDSRGSILPSTLLGSSPPQKLSPPLCTRPTTPRHVMSDPNPPRQVGPPCSTARTPVSLRFPHNGICSYRKSAKSIRPSTYDVAQRVFLGRVFLCLFADEAEEEEEDLSSTSTVWAS